MLSKWYIKFLPKIWPKNGLKLPKETGDFDDFGKSGDYGETGVLLILVNWDSL